MLHEWITHPRSRFWGALDASVHDIETEYARIACSSSEAAWILELNGTPLALGETYDPSTVLLDQCPDITLHQGDIGMHILVSPPTAEPIHGLTDVVLSGWMRWLFRHPEVQRIVVEPDERNTSMHIKNARVGFRQPGVLTKLPFNAGIKNALVQTCSREDFENSIAAPFSATAPEGPLRVPGRGTPESLRGYTDNHSAMEYGSAIDATHRELTAKAIQEFTHERLIFPETVAPDKGKVRATDGHEPADPWTSYKVTFGSTTITFQGKLCGLLHLIVDPASMHVEDHPMWRPNIVNLIAEAADQLGIPGNFLHTYLEEISATFATRLRTRALPRPAAKELVDPQRSLRDPVEAFQAIESAMTSGHPGFLANAGRGGMGETQVRAWAPELGGSTRLVWVAAAREHTQVIGGKKVDSEAAIRKLAPWFEDAARRAGIEPSQYFPLPLHPWQWEQKMTTSFAADIADRKLVLLGHGEDLYRSQQSLRTFFNYSRPEVPYVKTAVAVRNMGFTRGLSDTYMDTTPAVNDWLIEQLEEDPEFSENGIGFLPEIITIAYTGDVYHQTADKIADFDSPYLKMTAALWRRSPFDPQCQPAVGEGQTLSTMAAILHRDVHGNSIVGEWISQAGVEPVHWLDALLRVYLRPLVHALISKGIVFMPHTENVILRLEHGIPIGVYHKDLGEEVAVVSPRADIPQEIRRIHASCGDDDTEGWAQQALSIHTDVVDGVLRHLAALMEVCELLEQPTFWQRVHACLDSYASDHPGVTESGVWKALRAPEFRHSTLNRLQLRNPHSMVELGNQNSSLIYAGTLPNPLREID
ncbi:MAG TPA: GNAT family N-acetyltransferase [Candidatus Corynebacterium gallistercoris]|uniref:GNAT family N-acetyltransferase n=1 Tax=Candidatus Corynebacterium gallistercoris TaxID=2838530 RepID=A0A9D1URY9_9CORY|nr:GNAT family N-acetyltransferase [Candidatus Corynebacterium gallistercoris]